MYTIQLLKEVLGY